MQPVDRGSSLRKQTHLLLALVETMNGICVCVKQTMLLSLVLLKPQRGCACRCCVCVYLEPCAACGSNTVGTIHNTNAESHPGKQMVSFPPRGYCFAYQSHRTANCGKRLCCTPGAPIPARVAAKWFSCHKSRRPSSQLENNYTHIGFGVTPFRGSIGLFFRESLWARPRMPSKAYPSLQHTMHAYTQ